MDQKRTWLMMAVVLGLTFLWIQVVLPWLGHKYNWKTGPETPPPANVAATSPSTGPTTAPIFTTGPTTSTSAPTVKGGQPRQILIGDMLYDPKGLGPNGSYPLGLQL